jgi:hypothetical protein
LIAVDPIAWLGAITGCVAILLGVGNLIYAVVRDRSARERRVTVTATFRMVKAEGSPGYESQLAIRAVNLSDADVNLDSYAVSATSTGTRAPTSFRGCKSRHPER